MRLYFIIFRCVLLFSICVLTYGCATIFSTKSKTVYFTSDTTDVEVLVNGNSIGNTPTAAELLKQQEVHSVTFVHKDLGKKEFQINRKLNFGWLILDFLWPPALIVDAQTKKWYTFDANAIHAKFKSNPIIIPLEKQKLDTISNITHSKIDTNKFSPNVNGFIVLKTNDTIWCKITKVTSLNIFYSQNKVGKSISKAEIKSFYSTDFFPTNESLNTAQISDTVFHRGKNHLALINSGLSLGLSYERTINKYLSYGASINYRKQLYNERSSGTVTLITPFFRYYPNNKKEIPCGFYVQPSGLVAALDNAIVHYGPWSYFWLVNLGTPAIEIHSFTAIGFGIAVGYKHVFIGKHRHFSLGFSQGIRYAVALGIPKSTNQDGISYKLSPSRPLQDAPLSMGYYNLSIGMNF